MLTCWGEMEEEGRVGVLRVRSLKTLSCEVVEMLRRRGGGRGGEGGATAILVTHTCFGRKRGVEGSVMMGKECACAGHWRGGWGNVRATCHGPCYSSSDGPSNSTQSGSVLSCRSLC